MQGLSGVLLLLCCWQLFRIAPAKDLSSAAEPQLEGRNVCIDQINVTKSLNVSYHQVIQKKVYTLCFKIPPRCSKMVDKVVERYKLQNVTRIVNRPRCCKGYTVSSSQTSCEPVCTEPCVKGLCTEPEVCSCEPGWSGARCDTVGCPGGNWGPNCKHECPCKNGGRCEPHTGKCQCPPGFKGAHCQKQCQESQYGLDCAKICDCEVGTRCHHVTGECTPCPEGTFGQHCSETCTCQVNGTALCYHQNGNCFCKPNYYGIQCEMHCPFGYLNGVCHKEPVGDEFCSCASDLYRCDREEGCVCKDGLDCEGGTQFIDFPALQRQVVDSNTAGSSHTQAVAIVSSVLILALLITALVVFYYKRRMNRLQEDIKTRSVLYIENSVLSPNSGLQTNHDLVITNDTREHEATPRSNGAYSKLKNNLLVNNATVVTHTPVADAGANISAAGAAGISPKPEKNVNIDRFKLGDDEEEDFVREKAEGLPKGLDTGLDEEAEGAIGGAAAAAATVSDNIPFDINLYQEYQSPSKEKDNTKLADLYRKVSKANVDVAIINNSTGAAGAATIPEEVQRPLQTEDPNDDDDEEDLKMYVHK